MLKTVNVGTYCRTGGKHFEWTNPSKTLYVHPSQTLYPCTVASYLCGTTTPPSKPTHSAGTGSGPCSCEVRRFWCEVTLHLSHFTASLCITDRHKCVLPRGVMSVLTPLMTPSASSPFSNQLGPLCHCLPACFFFPDWSCCRLSLQMTSNDRVPLSARAALFLCANNCSRFSAACAF